MRKYKNVLKLSVGKFKEDITLVCKGDAMHSLSLIPNGCRSLGDQDWAGEAAAWTCREDNLLFVRFF